MAKRSHNSGRGRGTGKRQPVAAANQQAGKPADDDWNDIEGSDPVDEWTEIPVREKDSSRIRRQMEARRKLEQLMEARRLSSLVDDWGSGDDGYLSEERS